MNQELFYDYITELEDRTNQLYASISQIDQGDHSEENFNDIRRNIHSLKAAAYTVGLPNSGDLLHKLEDFIDLVIAGSIPLDETITTLLFECIDEIVAIAREMQPDSIEPDTSIPRDKLDLFICVFTGEKMEVEKEVEDRIRRDNTAGAIAAEAHGTEVQPVFMVETSAFAPGIEDSDMTESDIIIVSDADIKAVQPPLMTEPINVPDGIISETFEPFDPIRHPDKELVHDITEDINTIIEEMEVHFIELEKNSDKKDLLDKIFREIHTIKGDSGMVPIPQISRLAHYMENILDELRSGKYQLNPSTMDILLEGVDFLKVMLSKLKDQEPLNVDIQNIIVRLQIASRSNKSPEAAKPASKSQPVVSKSGPVATQTTTSKITTAPINHKVPESTWSANASISEELPMIVDLPESPETTNLNDSIEEIMSSSELSEISDLSDYIVVGDVNSTDEMAVLEGQEPISINTGANALKKLPAPILDPDKKSSPKSIQTLRVDIAKLDTGMNLMSEMVTNKIRFDERLKHLTLVVNNLSKQSKHLSEMKQSSQNLKIIENTEKRLLSRLNDEYQLSRVITEDVAQIFAEARSKLNKEQLIFSQNLKGILEEVKNEIAEADETSETLVNTMDSLGMLISGLQENLMKIRMLPVSTVFNKFPRMIRELARDRQKEVNLVITGEETELDKNLIEEIGDPIMHIVRNCIDHGLETMQERLAMGKSKAGTLLMNAFYEGNQVVIEISDDGRGIDPAKLRKAAVEKRYLTPEQVASMNDAEIRELIFQAGFSTAKEITDISGRGVGLDVVKSNILRLKGVVDLESKVGIGSSFKIRLPLTLAILQSLMVRCQTETFAIPISYVDKTIMIRQDDIKLSGTTPVINHLGKTVQLFRLSDILELENDTVFNSDRFPVIIVKIGKNLYALQVDELLGRRESVIKNLGTLLANIKHVTGATILGNGRVILILDIPAIITTANRDNFNFAMGASGSPIEIDHLKSEAISISTNSDSLPAQIAAAAIAKPGQPNGNQPGTATATATKPVAGPQPKDGAGAYVMVIEDSTTVRKSIVNMLQAGGYRTLEAEHGQQGVELAAKHNVELFTIDIMMPIMDGYETTRTLREMPQYKKTPIIIVSSKDKKVDKVKGLEAGADDYITKPFQKGKLIEIISSRLGK